jgi:hypothetical protein
MEDHFKQPQKKEYKVVKSNKKDIVSEPIVEVANSEQSSPPKVIEIDPILEGLLRNNEDRVPAASVIAPTVHVVNSSPDIDNVVVEVESSSDSEFVDATQPEFNEAGVTVFRNMMMHSESPADEISTENSGESVTPARIAQDMSFLKNSWANLADQEPDDESDHDFVNDDVPIVNNPAEETVKVPFQVVSNKKNRKKKHAASKTYSTRSWYC